MVITHPKHLELNEQYADIEKSPLMKEDLKKFVSLNFYPENEDFKVKAAFVLTPNEKPFEMKTSTERLPVYRKYGQLTFKVKGIEESLAAYQNQAFIGDPEYGNSLFIPYLDETNGIETYGGGRYIDIEIPAEGADSILLDLNESYNPYCAYNYKYSCPKPPLENVLDMKVEAGVKTGIIKR
ncbi:MAG: DUF1684 domain-containing protein [Flavobacteriales bacterium]|nr:DUF1684 domain-containing protein [Flavobacteriales bacterium]